MQRVNLLNKGHIDAAKADEHATSEDFRKLFTEDMTGLYLLSLLLTANHEKAEQCFVAGVEDTVKGNPVFKEWAHSWAKRTIQQIAEYTKHEVTESKLSEEMQHG